MWPGWALSFDPGVLGWPWELLTSERSLRKQREMVDPKSQSDKALVAANSFLFGHFSSELELF